MANVDIGEYRVTYQGNVFSAFSTDPLVVYKKGEQVYVLVPQGDFSGKKIILGRSAYENNMSYADQQAMTNIYIDKGPNWLTDWYQLDHQPLQICACPASSVGFLKHDDNGANYKDVGFMRYRPDQANRAQAVRYPTGYMTDEELLYGDTAMQEYAATYSYIKIAANFRTQFVNTHTIGKYSLVVELLVDNPRYDPDKDSPTYAPNEPQYIANTFELGFKDFNGTPYSFIVESPQKAYFPVEPKTIKGLSRIYLTQDGAFAADIKPVFNEKGQIEYKIDNAIYDTNNIFCDDIEIKFAEKINLTDGLFYCYIESPYGTTVYDPDKGAGRPVGRGSVDLIAHLIYGYEEILTEENCRVYWFRRRCDQTYETPTEEDRDDWNMTWVDYAGPGWIPIEHLMDNDFLGEDAHHYDVNFDTLTVYQAAVPWQWEYKAVVVYTGQTANGSISGSNILFATEFVTNLDSDYNLVLEQTTSKDKSKTYLQINNLNRNVNEIDPATNELHYAWFGTWWVERQDGGYYRVSQPYHKGPFEINQFLVNPMQVFYVQCYDPYEVDPSNEVPLTITGEQGGSIMAATEVGNLYKVIITAEEGDLSVDWVGRDHYNYDANGTLKDAAWDVDQTLEPELHWLDGKLSDYTIKMYGPDGELIGDRAYYDKYSETGSGKIPDIESSMMHQIWLDTTSNTIHYKVREMYDETRTDNTFTMVIKTVASSKEFKLKKTITFTKDGDQGTQGSDWAAPIWPCNYKYGPDSEEGPYIEKMDYPAPLVLTMSDAGEWVQNPNYRVFLRPFVTKNGRLVENIDPHEGYFYKVYWDVRMPYNHEGELVRRASFLRLFHANDPMVPGSESVYQRSTDGKSFYEAGGFSQKDDDVNPPGAKGLQAFSIYPSSQFPFNEAAIELGNDPEYAMYDNGQK